MQVSVCNISKVVCKPQDTNLSPKLTQTPKWKQDLPGPPIPTINETFSKYLLNLKSILSYTQFKITEESVNKFIASRDSKQLQTLLELYAKRNENWVTELWLDDMYLRNQVPLPVNSNPAFLLPRQQFDNHLEMLWFAAHFIQFTKLFNTRIQNQQLEQDTIIKRTHQTKQLTDNNNNVQMINNNNKLTTNQIVNNLDSINNGIDHKKINNQSTINQTPLLVKQQTTSKTVKQPLCMQTYKNIFKAYRRPGDEKDELILNQDTKYNHIVIACKNQFFALSLTVDQLSNESFIDYIYLKLIMIWEFCSKLDDKENKNLKQQPVGLYTTEHRRTWWQIRNNLIKKPQNLQSLTCIEKCLVVICLDDLTGQSTSKTHLDEADQLSRLLHGSQKYSSNRWFDKFLNIMIGTDGVFGFLMEHSASEGYGEEFLNYWTDVKDKKPNLSKLNSTSSTKTNLIRTFSDASNDKLISPGQVIHLKWQLDTFDISKLNEAKVHLESLIDGVDLNVQHFNGYGAKWIKQNQISPDCFVQLALQIVFYKLHGNLTSTYESGSLRRFKYGRVDNIRSNTIEALLLARAICGESPNTTKQEMVSLFRNALKKQVKIMQETISGYGIDNHILGIREMAMRHQSLLIRSNSESSDNTGLTNKTQKTDNLPEIFTTHAFKQFVNFQLSTSQVASSKGIVTAYGAVVRNGYGCCYNILPDKITFMVSSFLGGYNVSTNTYNNYNSNYSCSDSNISRSKMFSNELIDTFKELENLAIIDLNNNSNQ